MAAAQEKAAEGSASTRSAREPAPMAAAQEKAAEGAASTRSAREPATMAAAQEKAAACCRAAPAHVAGGGDPAVPVRAPAGKVVAIALWGGERVAASAAGAGGGAVIEDVAAVQPTTAKASSKGISIMTRAQSCHPLDPLSADEIKVAVATVRAAGRSPEERDSMRFVEVVLLEPDKNVVALADAYFFPPFQPPLPRTKGSAVIPSSLPPRRAKLVVYNKQSNETSIWIVELSEAHAGKVISTEVVPDVQPAMDATEYAECEATVKSYPPFIEAMKRRGVDDMDLVMVDAWCVGYHGEVDAPSRRLGKPLIFCRTESDSPMENSYARPVEGIHVIVDMQNNTVIEFEDRKVVPEEGSGPGSPRGSPPPRPPAGDDDNDENPHRIAVLALFITYAGGMMIGMGTQSWRIFGWSRAPKAVFVVFAVPAIVSLAVSLTAATSGVAGGPSQLVVSAFCAKLASIISTALLVEFVLCSIIGGRWGCLIAGVPSAALIAALLVALWIWRDKRAMLRAVSNCWGRITGRPRQQMEEEPAPEDDMA